MAHFSLAFQHIIVLRQKSFIKGIQKSCISAYFYVVFDKLVRKHIIT